MMLTGHNAVRGRLDLRRTVGTLCIAYLALLSGCAKRPSPPPPTGRIAFVSSRDPAGVYAINADGSDLTFLGGQPAAGAGPRWSPDGTKLALQSSIGGDFRIEVFSADGSNHAILQKGTDPAWSPDGKCIAFVHYPEGNAEIYTIRADGSDRIRLTTSPTEDWAPKWSPDGLRIAFVSVEGPVSAENRVSAVYVIDPDGRGLRPIRLAKIIGWPVWSPDGSRIAYVSDAGLQVMGADGSEVMTLATNARGGSEPAWSPDGTRIAFVCIDKRPDVLMSDICIVNADGRNMRRLTGNLPRGSSELHPSWSPDGGWIAFAATRPHFDIYIMTADGSSQTNLTDDPSSDLAPAWMP